MTTYTAITDASIDQDSPATVDLFTLIRNNPIAISEGATDAPVLSTGWHPYDMVLVGDGNDGEFYDFSTDGSAASVETPDFADGYEYAIRFEGISIAATNNVLIELYQVGSASWVTLATLSSVFGPADHNGLIEIRYPRLASAAHSGRWVVPFARSATAIAAVGDGVVSNTPTATASVVSKARVTASLTTFDAGKMFLLRRREYLTG